MEQILRVVESFYQMRQNLEEVYGRTRFLSQPEGFIEERNHHNHLAAKTLNSDWIYLYEFPMTHQVRNWAKKALK